MESGPNGARRFIVSTYAEFWRRYEAVPPKQRHHYEIIREGAPCHLYFGATPAGYDNASTRMHLLSGPPLMLAMTCPLCPCPQTQNQATTKYISSVGYRVHNPKGSRYITYLEIRLNYCGFRPDVATIGQMADYRLVCMSPHGHCSDL